MQLFHLLTNDLWFLQGNPTYDLKLQWGQSDSQKFSSTGTLINDGRKLSLNFVLDSPVLEGSPWTVDLSGSRLDPQFGFLLNMKSKDSRFVNVSVETNIRDYTFLGTYEFNLPNVIDGNRLGKIEFSKESSNTRLLNFEHFKNDKSLKNIKLNITESKENGGHLQQIKAYNCAGIDTSSCDLLDIMLNRVSFEETYVFHVIGERNGLKTGVGFDQSSMLIGQVWYPSSSGKQETVGVKLLMDEASSTDLYYIKSDVS